MAPVAAALAFALATIGSIEAKPLTPGRHAPPSIAELLSHSKRSLHSIYSRYYGSVHGLSKPAPLNEKRDVSVPAGWSYHGCVTESWDERLLQGFSFSSTSQTPLLCLTECGKKGYTLAGMEFGDECYCGNSYVGSGGTPNPDTSCSSPCVGDATVMCGNAWLLSLYTYNSSALGSCDATTTSISVPSATASASATSSVVPSANVSATATTSTSPTSTLAVHENAQDESEWYILGCIDDSSSPRVLTGYSEYYVKGLTTDSCLSLCEDKGFKYAGLEYGEECYCGNSIPSTLTSASGSCTMPCAGDSSDTCGGDWAMELYELASSSCDNTLVACPTSSSSSISSASATATSLAVSSAASSAVASSVTASPVSSAAPISTSVPASDDTHYVWAHHMVGNTYPYQVSDWTNDINKAYSYGIDGFALNMGSDYWQPLRIADAYSAAQASGTGFKLFLSLDMTVMGCGSWNDATTLVNLVKQFANHPNQAKQNGKVLVSTFAGSDCTFGTGSMNGWSSAFVNTLSAAGVDIFFVPSIFTDPSVFPSISFIDGELNWNSAWPMGDYEISTATDEQYMSNLSGRQYMAAISPFFFTHFGANSWNKNWLYRSDNWLYATRWEQLIAQRQSIKALEILTWNDYGESSYIGPIAGALPAGSEVWVNGLDHEGINVLTKYYSTAFKTGSYPAITQDSIVMWQRPHPHDATASNDGAGRPTGWNWTDDYLYAVVLTTGPATVTLTSGSNTQTFSVQGGLSKLKVPSSAGAMSGSIVRSGSTVASYASSGSVYTNNPVTYNFNYYLGSSS